MRIEIRVCAAAATIAAAAASLSVAAESPKAAGADRVQPWHVQLPRTQLLAAWNRLRTVAIPGVPVDMRFEVSGPTLFVSPTGDDAADGSRAKPWRTLQHAASQLKPNTVIYLDAGTYHGPVIVQTQASAEAPAAIRAAEGQHVILTYPDEFVAAEKAKVHSAPSDGRTRAMDAKGQELHYPPLIDVRGRFVEISGLHLIGAGPAAAKPVLRKRRVVLRQGRRRLPRAVQRDRERRPLRRQGNGPRRSLDPDRGQPDPRRWADVPRSRHLRPGRRYHGPKESAAERYRLGVHAYSTPKRIVATHNIVAGNDHHGIILGGPEALVAHNIFGSNHQGGLFFFRSGCKGCVVKNNIFYDDPAVDFDQMGDARQAPSGNVFDHNCLVPGVRLGKVSPQDTVGAKNVQVNPMVIDARSFDFRLGRRSPCINAGADVGLPFQGKTPDIGLSEAR